jgi:hypothetical protein
MTTNTEKEKRAKGMNRVIPINRSAGTERAIALAGTIRLRSTLLIEVLRHPSRGHKAIRIIRSRNKGGFTVLKNGGPTDIFTPFTASLIRGKTVPQKVAKQMPTSIMLL